MKQVRILTGVSAGAQLTLQVSGLKLGNGEEFDFTIDDWNHAPIELVIDEGGNVSAHVLTGNEANGRGELLCRLDDFVPHRFFDIVLCCGPVHGDWPSDMSLLEALMRPAAPAPAPAPASKPWRMAAALGLCAASLLGVFGAVVARHIAAEQQRQPDEPLLGQVARAIEDLPFRGLVATSEGDMVVVEGMLESSAQVNATRAALLRFPRPRIAHRYAAADQTVRSIVEALGVSGLTVEYRGAGVFAVLGQSQKLPMLREAVQRVAGDLGPLVKRIDVDVAALPPPERIPVGSVMAAEGLQVVETRDGAKYLTLAPLPVVELVDPPAARAR
jgi:type III secretion protein D